MSLRRGELDQEPWRCATGDRLAGFATTERKACPRPHSGCALRLSSVERARRMPAARTQAEVAARVRDVLPGLADEIVPHLLPAIWFDQAAHDESQAAVRLGGPALLPRAIAWPEWRGRPLHLVAVIDLELVAPVDPTGSLPRKGLLNCFMDVIDQPWGYDVAHHGAWSVIYVEDGANALERHRTPHELDGTLLDYPQWRPMPKPSTLPVDRYVAPWVQWMVPSVGEDCLEGLSRRSLTDGTRLWRLWEALEDLENSDVQMFGWPDPIQGSMRPTLEAVARPLLDGAPSSGDRSGEWRLLLQVPSWDEYGGAKWGASVGSLYYWIRDDDLRRCHFERAWAIIQSG